MPSTQHQQPSRIGTLASLRALVPKRPLTATDLRMVTERQATRLRQILNITAGEFPIEAINQIPRIELRPDPDLPTSAMAFWNSKTWVILVNTTETITRQRFSIMHELHHIICHTNKHHMFGSADMRNETAERAADRFAANVLMPKVLVKRHWGIGPRTVTTLARRFNVSPQAMSYRLDQLGLTEPKPRCAWTQTTDTFTKPLTALEIAA